MAEYYKVGTRTSPLALKQAEEVLAGLRKFYPEHPKGWAPLSRNPAFRLFPDFRAEIVGIDTYGDKDKTTPISRMEGTDFFTREIDNALLAGAVDFAVHSAKDLPDKLKKGLTIAALTKSADPYDALVSKSGLTLDKLPIKAKIGTSSLRRKKGLKEYRGDFQLVDIRGNIEERLEILDNSGLDAIVIASAGLVRLGLEHRIAQRIPFEIITPHRLQGVLALTVREEDSELIEFLSVMDSFQQYWGSVLL
jgi:hydroxymethylbilane synthase